MKSIFKYVLATVAIISLFTACDTQWDSHIAANELRGMTLSEAIAKDPQTSVFATILKKTGYDEVLSGDKILTVFAPVNEALTSVNMDDIEALKILVKSHIAYSNYTITEGKFSVDSIQMINSKNVSVENLTLDGINVISTEGANNLSVRNGIIHKMSGVIPTRKNIWEYLETISGNQQIDFIKAQDRKIMDMVKSIQIGVDATSGRPLYDTVWNNLNPFLELYPLNNENAHFTFVLLPNTVVTRIETKYAKYFAKNNPTKQDSIVRAEFLKDCILAPVKIDGDKKYISVDGVYMDITTANVDASKTYNASNGTVYTLNDADVKIYENKVKTIVIEGENYSGIYASNLLAWMKRYRAGLSGGQDMCLNSGTTYAFNYVYSNADTTFNVALSQTFYPMGSSNVGNVNNCYLEFSPVINSVPYKIYWSGYDDYSGHQNFSITKSVNNGTTTENITVHETCKFSQKLLMSFPDAAKVIRNASDGTIKNNFDTTLFTSTRLVAGQNVEKQLFRCKRDFVSAMVNFMAPGKNTTPTGEDDYFNFYNDTESDKYGNKEMIINPTYGKATILVANTAEYRASNAGMIFLDYIKLVPVVDPNE